MWKVWSLLLHQAGLAEISVKCERTPLPNAAWPCYASVYFVLIYECLPLLACSVNLADCNKARRLEQQGPMQGEGQNRRV